MDKDVDDIVGIQWPSDPRVFVTDCMSEPKCGKARRIWVMHRGIVSEENLAAIRKRRGQYLAGTPQSQMKQFEAELLKDDWIRVRPEVKVRR